MELQWPLIIFTTLVAWSAGLFASQCVLALKGGEELSKSQMPAWIASAVLLVAGGIAVFMHLEHWERIFNGFGHITSGITQELIAIVILAIVAIVYLVYLRKGSVPSWLAILGIVVSALLVIVMAHSYMMPSRPAWNSFAWILAVVGNACVLGPATMAAISGAVDAESDGALVNKLMLIGAAVNAVTTIVYIAAAALATSSFTAIPYHFNPVSPLAGLVESSAYSPFASGSMIVSAVAIVTALAAAAFAFFAKKKNAGVVWGSVVAVLALVAAIAVRVVFYNAGASVFMLF